MAMYALNEVKGMRLKMKNSKQDISVKQQVSDFKKTLSNNINDANQVFIISHKKLDYDAAASLLSMAVICKKHKKASYIIIDDKEEDLSDEVLQMVDKIKETFIVITTDHYENNRTDNDLLITVDVNKDYLTSLEGKYKKFKNIIIIDHHTIDENTIKTNKKLVINNTSSCSEIMYYLLSLYKINSINPILYTYLLAGIYLDTNKLNKNKYISTLDAVKELINKGADQNLVEDFFALDFESDRKVHALVDNLTLFNLRFMVSVLGDGTYTETEIAKAADYALNYKCDAVIVAGKTEDGGYKICARGKGNIAVNNIMYILNNGGGNINNASGPLTYVDNEGEIKDGIKKVITFNKINNNTTNQT